MVFSDLSLEAQNYLLVNHGYLAKWLVFLVLIFFSCYYLFVMWREQQPTKFFTVVTYRLVFLAFSVGQLVTAPFMLLLMTPEYSFQEFYFLYLILYGVVLTIATFIFLADLLRYGIIGALKLGGLDLGDSNANEVIRALESNKHFMKWGKRR